MKKYKNDFLLIGFLLFLCFVSFFVMLFRKKTDTDKLQIYGDGVLLSSIPTDQNLYILVYREDGGYLCRQYDSAENAFSEIHSVSDYNLIEIMQGTVSVCAADCSGQDCARQKSISGNGEAVICLPHRVLLCLTGEKEKTEDAVTW